MNVKIELTPIGIILQKDREYTEETVQLLSLEHAFWLNQNWPDVYEEYTNKLATKQRGIICVDENYEWMFYPLSTVKQIPDIHIRAKIMGIINTLTAVNNVIVFFHSQKDVEIVYHINL